ncbi:hypothetical protein C1H46_027152 [Malus baccata]|uniref:Uncharacterized protein n=1 Tax=Malus baccata TaxID=106549 RepID=A0A540LLD0_MALBA|nr:hypothetical protein C1H46_027152 [Malus baccata]
MAAIARISRRALTLFSSSAQPSAFHRTFSVEAAKAAATTPLPDQVALITTYGIVPRFDGHDRWPQGSEEWGQVRWVKCLQAEIGGESSPEVVHLVRVAPPTNTLPSGTRTADEWYILGIPPVVLFDAPLIMRTSPVGKSSRSDMTRGIGISSMTHLGSGSDYLIRPQLLEAKMCTFHISSRSRTIGYRRVFPGARPTDGYRRCRLRLIFSNQFIGLSLSVCHDRLRIGGSVVLMRLLLLESNVGCCQSLIVDDEGLDLTVLMIWSSSDSDFVSVKLGGGG